MEVYVVVLVGELVLGSDSKDEGGHGDCGDVSGGDVEIVDRKRRGVGESEKEKGTAGWMQNEKENKNKNRKGV